MRWLSHQKEAVMATPAPDNPWYWLAILAGADPLDIIVRDKNRLLRNCYQRVLPGD